MDLEQWSEAVEMSIDCMPTAHSATLRVIIRSVPCHRVLNV